MRIWQRIWHARAERGFTLLEYCAGAAVIATVVFAGLQLFGTSLSEFFDGLGAWVTARKPPAQ